MTINLKRCITIVSTLILFSFVPVLHAEWVHGIGTGITATSLDGDIGFDTTTSGPVEFNVDLDNSEYSDLVKSGFGFAGFSAKDKWKIGYVLSTVSIEDRDDSLLAEWDRTKLEVVASYNFANTGNHSWGAVFGVRNIAHEWKITVSGSEVVNIDESWTDAVLGLGHSVPIADRWRWANLLQATFGESEGTSSFNTALTWQAHRHWVISFVLNFEKNEFKVGEPGDSDFYLYDVSEPSYGVGFVYLW